MAGIYFHFPFCRQACHYCNFHFSTRLTLQERVWKAMQKELLLRKAEMSEPLESIYFGGGSPSLLSPKQLETLINLVFKHFNTWSNLELTLEVNPEDVTLSYLKAVKAAGINRLSLGVQSFKEDDLRLMNRSHNTVQAEKALEKCSALFDNFSIDLIYGMPYSSSKDWEKTVRKALAYHPPHVSAYALTVEPKTAFAHQVKKATIVLLEEEKVKAQYDFLIAHLEAEGYENYEFSNFAKPNFQAVNNSNYWKGKPYLGIGPAAHSYDGKALRSWNVSHNLRYCKAIESNRLPSEKELLKESDCYNEYVMTGLRTTWGISLEHIKRNWGEQYAEYLMEQAHKHIQERRLYQKGDFLKVSKAARFLSDGLAADLFFS